jgi:hypothetical protein
MGSSYDYTEFAEECLVWARTAKSLKERAIFLQMALTWLEAATAQVAASRIPPLQPRQGHVGRVSAERAL